MRRRPIMTLRSVVVRPLLVALALLGGAVPARADNEIGRAHV